MRRVNAAAVVRAWAILSVNFLDFIRFLAWLRLNTTFAL